MIEVRLLIRELEEGAFGYDLLSRNHDETPLEVELLEAYRRAIEHTNEEWLRSKGGGTCVHQQYQRPPKGPDRKINP